MWHQIIRKIVKFLDPKLDKYREHRPRQPVQYTPQTLADLVAVIQRTPKHILSNQDRNRIAAIMNFDNRQVEDLMVPKSKMVFVNAKDTLGPLTLDKLYRSGFKHFPVIDRKEQILGVIHTEALNTLEIKKTAQAEKYLDPTVHYLHAKDSLEHAINEIERTNSYYFLVLDHDENLTGFFTIQALLDYLIN